MSVCWKALEYKVAEKLGGHRISRANDFSESTFDVSVPDMAHWRIDAKHRAGTMWHHTRLAEVRKKYCKAPFDVAILITKAKGTHGEVVSMSLEDFADMLGSLRMLKQAASIP